MLTSKAVELNGETMEKDETVLTLLNRKIGNYLIIRIGKKKFHMIDIKKIL